MSRSGWPFNNVHVGSPTPDFPMEDVKLVHFHNFESLTTVRGEMVESPEFVCAGQKWKLQMYPGGDRKSREGSIAVHLCCILTPSFSDEIEADFTINVKKANGSDFVTASKSSTYAEDIYYEFNSNTPSHGDSNLIALADVLDESTTILDEDSGTLTFEVHIRICHKSYAHIEKPATGTVGENMFRLFLQENERDVAFKVKGTTVTAHRAVLKAQAPELAELCETYDLANPMPIEDVNPDTFKMMIEYLYGETIHHKEWLIQSQYLFRRGRQDKSILRASGKYGMNTLRSEAEAWCVKWLWIDIKVNNAIEYLMYADANNLTYLKRSVMNYIMKYAKDVVSSESYSLLSESPVLMQEVMKAMADRISGNNKRQRLT